MRTGVIEDPNDPRLTPFRDLRAERDRRGDPVFVCEGSFCTRRALENRHFVVETVLAQFGWDDVGLWTALPKHLKTDAAGNATRGAVVVSDAANNIAVSNGRTIALCGVKDLVVVETADAILVCHRDAVQDIKKIVQQLPKELL